MLFNPDVSKQAQEIIFSKKSHNFSHPSVLFNNSPVQRTSTKKHLAVYLDEKRNLNTHIGVKIAKARKGIGVIKKLSSKRRPSNYL